MDFLATKINHALYPADDEAHEALKKIKAGETVRLSMVRPRNLQFHRKWWALVNLAFDYWEPDPENQVGEKNLDRFRKDIIILAGFYERYVRLDGSTRIEPKSISFAKMSEDEFADLYNKTIDVIIKYALSSYTGDMLRSIVDQVEEFDG